ncbi:hypothetical protein [Pseudonocardia sp. H11422]|uniref:hypothetical protein n=1 Tax=Pseudonocardia sp. H11422 TaxID=2835866 RepID=UPI001BDCEB06|nr:hypothetical protein [Pseudonocardia sp. H11422]
MLAPAHGWSLSRTAARPPLHYYAGPQATPLHLVPTAPEVLQWATAERDGPVTEHPTPPGVELDDDPEAVHRLLGFIDPQRRVSVHEAFTPADRHPAHTTSLDAPIPVGHRSI